MTSIIIFAWQKDGADEGIQNVSAFVFLQYKEVISFYCKDIINTIQTSNNLFDIGLTYVIVSKYIFCYMYLGYTY